MANGYSIKTVDDAGEIIDSFFLGCDEYALLFKELLLYIHSLDSEIVLRYNDDIIGASHSKSVFHFYTISEKGEWFIKFKHILNKIELKPS